MALEIHNGYRIVVRRSRTQAHHSLEDVYGVLDAFKQAARPVIQTLVDKRAAQLCGHIVDQRALETSFPIDGTVVPADWSPLIGATSIMLDRYGRWYDGDNQDPIYSLDAQVTIVPADGEVLALLWTEQSVLVDAWESVDGVELFAYWDVEPFEAERPRTVSKEEWAVRRGAWSSIVGHDTWEVAGLTTPVLGRYGLPAPQIDGIMAYMPTPAERAKLFAMHRLLVRQCRAYTPTDSFEQLANLDQELARIKGTRDGNAAFRYECDQIANVLPEITAWMLVHEEERVEAPR